tara:strand:+ start:1016 stop:1369 length:354 start_codon:yes stop_codon:yes gene_type:complete
MASVALYSYKKGLGSWVLQRISALFLIAYIVPLLFFWVLHAEFVSPMVWKQFLLSTEMRILGILASLSLVIHAMIGAWVVATDYIHIDGIKRVTLALFYVITVGSSVAIIFLLLNAQ